MQILLLCPGASTGQAAFRAELIEGIWAPERRYDIQDGKIVLSGFDEVILHHDADELLKQSLFRMPTPAEQEATTQQAQQSGQILESTELSDVPSVVDESPADADSSAQGKKKASGG